MIVRDSIYKGVFFTWRLVVAVTVCCALFVCAYWWSPLFVLAQMTFVGLMIYLVIEGVVLFREEAISAHRELPNKFSNGDENPIRLHLTSSYDTDVELTVLDEWPDILQARDVEWRRRLSPGESIAIKTTIRPSRRGDYTFGHVVVFVSLWLGLLQRRYRFDEKVTMKVYPSFLHLRDYELRYLGDVQRAGMIQQRMRLGHGVTFEQIKTYVQGDPQRWINWKATAKRQQLMVNQYSEEWSKDLWCIIDKGRLMRMPFGGLSLLDHAINAAMAVSHIATKHEDHIGLFSFSHKLSTVLMPGKGDAHLKHITEVLYRQRTRYQDSRYDRMVAYMLSVIRRRSLILLFTNFETYHAYELRKAEIQLLARQHHVAVLFFENEAVQDMATDRPSSLQQLYEGAVAREQLLMKSRIVEDLMQSGIIALQVSPTNLGLAAIDQYLVLREAARGR